MSVKVLKIDLRDKRLQFVYNLVEMNKKEIVFYMNKTMKSCQLIEKCCVSLIKQKIIHMCYKFTKYFDFFIARV